MDSGIIYPVNPVLSSYIEYYWYLCTGNKEKCGQTILPPEPCSDILLSFAGPTSFETSDKREVRLNSSFLLTIRKQRYLVTSRERIDYLAIRFKPHALYSFIHFPVSELSSTCTLEMNLLDKSFWNDVTEKISAIDKMNQRITLLESELVKQLRPLTNTDDERIMKYFIQKINASSGRLNISALAEQSGVGEKKLERMFKKYVGTAPKPYSRIVRFTYLFNYLNTRPASVDWADVVSSYGYFDQSHMIKEFSGYTGYSPENYLRVIDDICS